MKSDGKVVISTALDNKGLEKGLGSVAGSLGGLAKTVAKTTAVITTAFATAAIAVTKMATDAYAEYEQLVGGVETLFKASADKVMAYAEDAFYTVGISANEYMATVTSFSASLISSLGGDTDKAADVANTALVDMADNANKMGSTLESVKTAYQGFAKQQYQLLDNLKLGYGGTKTEMERLLKDAEAFSGVKYDINNLGDVYEAIHQIQVKLDIAGTTAKEAEKTITGSANMTKAAWKNVLTAIAGGGDLDKAINNLVYSISKYFENIVPVVERSLAGIGELIEKIAPQLVQTVATALIKAIPSLLNAVYQMIIGLAKGIYEGIVALFAGGSATGDISAQLNNVAESAGTAADAERDLADGITEASKAAKKSLAGFDELNILHNDTGDATETAGSAAGVSVNTPVVPSAGEIESAADSTGSALSALREQIKRLSQWTGFTELFENLKAGIEKIDFSAIKTNFAQVFNDLEPIAQASFDGVGTISKSFNKNVGKILGGIASIAGKEIEIATGGVVKFLESEKETISKWITETSQKIATGFDNLSFSADLIFGSFWTALDTNQIEIETSISGLLTSFSDMGMTVGTIFSDMWLGITDGFAAWTEEHKADIEAFFNGIIELGTSFSDTISQIIGDLFGSVMEWWNTDGKEIWDGIVACVGDIMDWVLKLWNESIQPVVQHVMDVAKELWDEHLKPLWDSILELVTSVGDFLLTLWDTILKPVIDWIVDIFGPWFKNVFQGVSDFVGDAIGLVIDAIRNVVKVFKNILNFITCIFKGDWEGAWESIKQFFCDIWDGVWDAIRGVINLVIDAINTLWSGLYNTIRVVVNGIGDIASTIGDLFGQDWGFSIPEDPPKIPRLAQGAVLPPNKPFMAVVGDQKHGTNIEAPLATIQEAVANVMQDQISATLAAAEAIIARQDKILEAIENIEVGDTTIGEAAKRYSRKQAIVCGGAYW